MSDGSSVQFGSSSAEKSSSVDLQMPYQGVVGFFALKNFDSKIESLGVIFLDCVLDEDGSLIRWQDLPPEEDANQDD